MSHTKDSWKHSRPCWRKERFICILTNYSIFHSFLGPVIRCRPISPTSVRDVRNFFNAVWPNKHSSIHCHCWSLSLCAAHVLNDLYCHDYYSTAIRCIIWPFFILGPYQNANSTDIMFFTIYHFIHSWRHGIAKPKKVNWLINGTWIWSFCQSLVGLGISFLTPPSGKHGVYRKKLRKSSLQNFVSILVKMQWV